MSTPRDKSENTAEILRRLEALERRLQQVEERFPKEPPRAPARVTKEDVVTPPAPDLAAVSAAISKVTSRRPSSGRSPQEAVEPPPSPPRVVPPPLPPAVAEASPAPGDPPPASVTAAPKERGEPAAPWGPRLRAAGLLPPERDAGDDFEKTLGTWWATRIGAVLAVLGSVFFAIHVSRDAGPGARFLLLAAGSLATLGLGVFLERKLPSFGRVISGMGLALIFYCAFAAYAVEAVRVTSNPFVSGLFQLMAAAGAMAYAARKEAEPIGVMALLLGYLACWFSLQEDLLEFAIGSSAVLVLAAAAMLPARRWTTLWWITVAPHFATTLTALLVASHGMGFRIGVCLGSFLLFALPEWVLRKRGQEGMEPLARLLLFAGAGASVLTVSATLDFPEDQAKWAFLVVGSFLCFWAWVDRWPGVRPAISGALIAKGSGLIALAVILHFDTLARWMILFAEAAILLAVWKRVTHIIVGVAFVVLMGVAGVYYLADVPAAVLRGLLSQTLAFLFPAGVVALLAWGEGRTSRWSLGALWGAGGFVGIMAMGWWLAKGSEGGWVYAITASIFVAALVGNNRGGWLSFPFMAAGWGVGLLFNAFPGEGWLVNGTASSCLCFLAAWGVRVSFRASPGSDTGEFAEFVSGLFVLLGVGVLAFAVRGTWEAPGSVVLCAVLYGALVLTGLVFSLRSVVITAVVPLLVFWGIQGVLGPAQDVGLWGWAAFVLGLGVVWTVYRSAHGMALVRIEGMNVESVMIGHLVVVLLTGFATASQHGEGLKVILAAMISVAMLPWAWSLQGGRGWRAPWYAGGLWMLWGSWYGIIAFGEGWANEVLPGSLLMGAVLLAYPAIIKRLFPMRDRESFSAVTSFLGIVFLLLLFLTLSGQEHILRRLVTVCWAACALALVAVGLLERLKPFRIVGLVGLALCLIRVFGVDVQSTTWRIVAFIGLGGLLLVVGFLYTRFAERLLGDEPPAAGEPGPEETADQSSA